MATSELTKIERKSLIHASRARVWHALTNPADFSRWFAADFTGSFEPGKRLDMISTHPCAKDAHFYVIVERLEPGHTFSWRWHPGSASASEDGTTLVEFKLQEVPDGTLVTVTETGFDRISTARRVKAFEENERGWETQMESLSKYASQAA
jgi:uncharacterized protein YndB with AHSA1/START domain